MSLKALFKEVLENVYKGASSQVDFRTKHVEVIRAVNQWVEKQTNGLIKEVLGDGDVSAKTRLICANAIYFKGAWKDKFDASKTKDHEFHLLDGTSVHVPFMTSVKDQYLKEFDDFKVLGLPYKQGQEERRFTMYIFLPEAKDGLPHLLSRVSSESGFIDCHIPNIREEVGHFLIPKFKISFEFEASEVLQRLGLVSPFAGDGLTEMANSRDGEKLHVSKFIHKAFIEVNEEGTEAAAVTMFMGMASCSLLSKKLNFVADHPFFFIIRENKTGVLLFTGQVLDPSS